MKSFYLGLGIAVLSMIVGWYSGIDIFSRGAEQGHLAFVSVWLGVAGCIVSKLWIRD